ncbi:endonuclease MutS2 [Ethanoligenens sp.]|uniref:endonuclease MutS2 n=1 Tax=Ethanoligenens sp. TaxID=2099655 RepID=UPI0039E9CAFA
MDSFERSYIALEYNRVRERLGDACVCAGAARRAQALLPADTLEDACEQLAQTADAIRLSTRFGDPPFSGVKEVSDALQRAKIGASLQMGDLLRVAKVLSAIRALVRYRDGAEGETTCLDEWFDALAPNKYLEEKITAAILPEEEMADTASGELADIRRNIRRAGQRVREQLDKMVRSQRYAKFLQESIVTQRGGRFVIPVRSEYRSEVPGLVHDTSASGATLFIEPMAVVEADNELKVLYAKEEKEVERILAALSAEVALFADVIVGDIRTAETLDFIFARARLAFSMKAGVPTLTDDGIIDLHRARHPLLPPEKAVPIDIRLGETFGTLVITGPNTGGKTVALKTLGLVTLMAMSGLAVPVADDSKLSFFEQVLADIGDEQSIEQSLSTFSAHMTNIVGILHTCGPHSLVLLDELGSGTDPTEGAALAVAILEHLKLRGAKVAATTHYAELKIYALETPGVENGSCEFDVATLRPTYRLLIGVPGRSNAFAISAKLGLYESVIIRAKALLSTEDTRFEQVVEGLEKNRLAMEAARAEAEALRRQAAQDREAAAHLREQLESTREKELERARTQAQTMVGRARAEAQALLADIDELRKMEAAEKADALRELAKSTVGARLKELEKTADPVRRKQAPVYHLPRKLRAGDRVLINDIDQKGTVLSPTDTSGMVEVQAGIIKTRVPENDLRLLENERVSVQARASGGRVARALRGTHAVAQTELDLRGQTVQEALEAVDKFIDDARLSALGQVSIIHGKGTGALRNAVQQHLKGNRSIKSFRLGRYGEGENGVTIVELS